MRSEWQQFSAFMQAWRSQAPARVLAFAILVPAMMAPALGWRTSCAWLSVYLALQAIQWFAFGPRAIEALVSGRRRTQGVVLTVAQAFAFGASALLMASSPSNLGIAFAAMLLAAGMPICVTMGQGSRVAFAAMLAPLAMNFVIGLPLMVWSRFGRPDEAATFSVCGALMVATAVLVWRKHVRLLDFEAHARAELEIRRAEAVAATEAKSRFVAAVSHELRTPLSAIQAGASAIASAPDAACRRQAALIGDASGMMRALLNDLLDLAKIEAGRMSVEDINFDVRSMLVTTLRFWRVEARGRGVRLRAEGGRALPRSVRGDPTRLRQILNNLLSNALKFTTEGSVTVAVRTSPARLCIAVRDTGAGMTSDQLDRLFQPFAQAAASTARTHGGTGLGLSISRELARLMGGDITVTSAPGQGSEFVLELPLRTSAPEKADEGPDAQAPDTALPQLRVLAVDDHEFNRRAFQLLLEPLGISLAEAADGDAALQLLAVEAFDVVLLDINMPGLDGFEVLRRLRGADGLNLHTRVLAVTGAVGAADHVLYAEAGFDGVVEKPLQPAELIAAIATAAEGAASENAPIHASHDENAGKARAELV